MDDDNHNKMALSSTPSPAQGQPAAAGFYLPDLCQVKAVFFTVLVAELLAIVLTINSSGVMSFDWQHFALTSLFCQWAFLSSSACLCQLRPWLARLPLALGAAVSYSLIVFLIALLAIAGQWLLASATLGGAWSLDVAKLFDTVIIGAILAGIALRYFYLAQQLQQRQQAELKARIQALQSRIRPHFLFNSMNIIASLIAIDQQAAEKAVEDLSNLFRASLSDSDSQGTLGDELELCQSYARIEQNRLGERLQLDWQAEGAPLQLAMPRLTLQPLLENAIYHGIQNLMAGGTVSVLAKYENQRLTVTVSNPYNPKQHYDAGHQMAIPNIEYRLKALYGDKATLLTEHSELAVAGDGEQTREYRVTVSYPVELEGTNS